jgi:hypothetical protein
MRDSGCGAFPPPNVGGTPSLELSDSVLKVRMPQAAHGQARRIAMGVECIL